MQKDERGNITVEAAIVVPLMMLFIAALLIFNLKVFAYTNNYCNKEHESEAGYAETHRKVSSVYDACENIYEILFG